jgi:hypothetical protein
VRHLCGFAISASRHLIGSSERLFFLDSPFSLELFSTFNMAFNLTSVLSSKFISARYRAEPDCDPFDYVGFVPACFSWPCFLAMPSADILATRQQAYCLCSLIHQAFFLPRLRALLLPAEAGLG